MESPAVDDDICILKHETAYVSPESPVSVCAGDESVASHFALVTAYEDIKKRLRDTEKENGLLRRRVKQLEDKHFRPEAPPSEGPQYMNKAFSAYRGIYIEKEDLQMELNKVKKEKLDSERLLTEQLQAKELELLQLRSEMETSQGDAYQLLNDVSENCVVDEDQSLEALIDFRTMTIVQSYQDVLSEVSRLRSVVQSQSELVRRMRERPALPVFRIAASTVPVQCLDDVAPPLPGVRLNPTLRMSSLDDSSWSFPSPPRPSDALFWDQTTPKSPAGDWAQPH
uniref:5-azacytidine induced 2 n=1 Tax=Cyprinus carpio TaxID=7962 RepID=A0A8C1Z1Y3_CYPCA